MRKMPPFFVSVHRAWGRKPALTLEVDNHWSDTHSLLAGVLVFDMPANAKKAVLNFFHITPLL